MGYASRTSGRSNAKNTKTFVLGGKRTCKLTRARPETGTTTYQRNGCAEKDMAAQLEHGDIIE
eukprot:11169439-Lingulodinium_polyedra.AAC.1